MRLITLLLFSLSAAAQMVPMDRRIIWDVGARTDWSKTRTTICTTLSPSGDGNDADNITAALSACPTGQVVKLGVGTFDIASAVTWPKSSVGLRGSGPRVTILRGVTPFSGDKFFDFYNNHGSQVDWDWSVEPYRTLAVDVAKGATRLTFTGAHGWSVGEYGLIDQDNCETCDPAWDDLGSNGECGWCSRLDGERIQSQMFRITNVVDSTTIDIEPPLFTPYLTAQNTQAIRARGHLYDISIESLRIDNTLSNATYTFYSYGLNNSLFDNLDVIGIGTAGGSAHFKMFNGLWNTIRNSQMRYSMSNQTNHGYGVFLGFGTTGWLVTQNICDGLVLCIAGEGATSGHVWSYNRAAGSIWYNDANRLPILGHGGGTHMVLVEGNYIEGRLRTDYYFGSQHYFFGFRNRVLQQSGKNDMLQTVDLEKTGHYSSIIGNVLGTDGLETVYECENDDGCTSTTPALYRLGYTSPYDTDASGNDAQVKATMLRHLNYDTVTDGTKACGDSGEPGCQGGDGSTSLPASLYSGSRPPRWRTPWGTPVWPPIGPDVTGQLGPGNHAAKIPAQLCWEQSGGDNFDADACYLGDARSPYFVGPVRITGWRFGQ